MNKSTLIGCVVVLLGIAYFDDIKSMFTSDDEKAGVIMEEYMKQNSQSTQGNSDGRLLIENSSAGHYDGPVKTTPVITIDNDNSSNSSSNKGHRCSVCKGKGFLAKESTNSMVAGKTQWCDVCNEQVLVLHSHISCETCGGDGWIDGY